MPDNKIFTEANAKICLSLIEKYFATPHSKPDKHRKEFYTESPLRVHQSHTKGTSTFSINIETGLYNDRASGDHGNFIQLVSKKFGLSLLEAAKKIISDSGGVVMDDRHDSKHNTSGKQHDKKDTKEKPKAIIPIPPGQNEKLQELVQSDMNFKLHGKAVRIYPYKNYDGESWMCTCRYEKEIDGKIEKEIIPYYFSAQGWRASRPPLEKYPLYNEHLLKGNNLPVLATEGEKCASVKVDGYINVSWLGGTGSVERANWEILQNRKVVIWPDADEPGIKAALYIKSVVKQAEILDIKGE